MTEWDGTERRESDITTFRLKLLEKSIIEIKEEVKDSRKEVSTFMQDMITMKLELKDLVSRSTNTRSTIVSAGVSIFVAVASAYLTFGIGK